jgi:hypothetical protein
VMVVVAAAAAAEPLCGTFEALVYAAVAVVALAHADTVDPVDYGSNQQYRVVAHHFLSQILFLHYYLAWYIHPLLMYHLGDSLCVLMDSSYKALGMVGLLQMLGRNLFVHAEERKLERNPMEMLQPGYRHHV